MAIAVDIREACRSSRTGKGQWVFGFVQELLRRNAPVILLSDAALPPEWAFLPQQTVLFKKGWKWHLKALKYLRSQKEIDTYVSPTSFIVPFLLGRRMKCIPVIHDLIAFQPGAHEKKARIIERLLLGRVLKNAAHICAISESTKRDLLARFPFVDPAKVTAIYAGPMRQSVSPQRSDGKTILCIGTFCPRKNQRRLIEAYRKLPAALRSRYRLVLAGARGWADEEIVRLASATPGVEWKGYVSADAYETLLSSCAVFALPSLYEGFGMQILDALQRGVPLLASSGGSLAEVIGEAGLLVDPLSVDSIAAGLERILTDEHLQNALRAAGPAQAARFSWKRTVDLFFAVLSKVSR